MTTRQPDPPSDPSRPRRPDTLSISEAAAVTGIPARTLREWARTGRLTTVRIGRGYRIPAAALPILLHHAPLGQEPARRPSEPAVAEAAESPANAAAGAGIPAELIEAWRELGERLLEATRALERTARLLEETAATVLRASAEWRAAGCSAAAAATWTVTDADGRPLLRIGLGEEGGLVRLLAESERVDVTLSVTRRRADSAGAEAETPEPDGGAGAPEPPAPPGEEAADAGLLGGELESGPPGPEAAEGTDGPEGPAAGRVELPRAEVRPLALFGTGVAG